MAIGLVVTCFSIFTHAFCFSVLLLSFVVLSIHFAGRIFVFHVQFSMERRHDDHVIVQLSAHEMQHTRMLRGRYKGWMQGCYLEDL